MKAKVVGKEAAMRLGKALAVGVVEETTREETHTGQQRTQSIADAATPGAPDAPGVGHAHGPASPGERGAGPETEPVATPPSR